MDPVTHVPAGGRVNQKRRTRAAIVSAAAELILTGRELTMPEIAKAALVSEATAYRYFPDLASLLREGMADHLPDAGTAVDAFATTTDPVARVSAAAEYLFRLVLARQGAVRAMIGATITRPGDPTARPVLRFGLIEQALAPLEETLGVENPSALAQLKLDLAIVVSAEAFFCLTDLYRLTPEAAIASAVHTAATLTRAALS